MSKSLLVRIPEKTDAFSRIKKFMSNHESGVVLTAVEEKMLTRLIYANGLLSEKKFTREQVAEKIKAVYGVSIYTARADINNTYSLFVSITEDYKRYTLFHHIEFLQQKLQQWKDDKSMAPMLPKLAAEITRAIAAMPVEVNNADVPAPVVLVQTTVNIVSNLTAADALKEADELIEFEKNHEYTEYEDLKNEQQ